MTTGALVLNSAEDSLLQEASGPRSGIILTQQWDKATPWHDI